jgi:hypothetical protein
MLVRRSSKAVHETVTPPTMRTARTTPDPRLGVLIQLLGGEYRDLLDLLSVDKGLTSERLAAKKTPPTFLQIEPTGPLGEKDLVNPGMGL